METIYSFPPINRSEEWKWSLAVSSFKATNSVFNITSENNSFSISIPDQWIFKDSQELFNKLNNLLQFKSENDIELHVKEVEKRGTRIKIENSGYNSAGFDLFKGELLSELNE